MTNSVTEYGTHNLGLFTLPPPHPEWEKKYGPPDLDVVAVHGLNGDCFRTWIHEEPTGEKTMWLKELLLPNLPRTRAMTFGYNASVVGNTSVMGIRENARSLLTFLRNKREGDGTYRRRLVFVGHSLGGIIIKQALRLARNEPKLFGHIADCTKGIVFFGTPHRGTDVANWGEVIAGIKAASFGTRPKTPFLKMLRYNSKDLLDLSDEFRTIAENYALMSFVEANTFRKVGRVIVAHHSAILGLPHEDYLHLPGDHSSMVKFSASPDDAGRFDAVWRGIQRAALGPPNGGPATAYFEIRGVYSTNNVGNQRDSMMMMQNQYGGGAGRVVRQGVGSGRLENQVGIGKGLLGWQQGNGVPRWEGVVGGEKTGRERGVWEEDEEEIVVGGWK
ncbi:Alpha/Beta hydrolase protein [Staphylotrichum tortipilum]|uniref:Alpha/Beta hydrolase protein n=1 Tax=Staphylotrichum tortipilum TaxID=2831512 RepID=A0AAN6MG02_9PEZI|nr:Alpha/Beta hydrolase protein [Staphylotrichum longicolle]